MIKQINVIFRRTWDIEERYYQSKLICKRRLLFGAKIVTQIATGHLTGIPREVFEVVVDIQRKTE